MAPNKPYDPATRAQALTMLQLKRPITEIVDKTGLNKSTIGRIEKRAKERGYTPETSPTILLAYVEDAPRAGRPKKVTLEVEEKVIEAISKNSTTRLLSTQAIANLVSPLVHNGISARTVHRVLRRKGYKPCKPTTKPGLTNQNKLTRLQWCLDHKDWTLEDWKNVIWSDETSVTWGGQRGRMRVWRTSSEAYKYHCIRRRWKGFKQFMFWACFSYDEKGPCHIWEEETTKEKKEAKEYMDKENEKNEAGKRKEWELETAMRRVGLSRRIRGAKPRWRWNAKTGKLERKACRGGIDWYRYWRVILEKKLLPFAKRCKLARPDTIVQEDNAPAHAHHHQATVYNLWEIMKLIWPANSPDLNAIEPCWFWMKRQTTKRGMASSEKQLKKDWLECWEKLPQEKIQEWIKRIPEHIQKIIDCGGGNEYREGSGKSRNRNVERVHESRGR